MDLVIQAVKNNLPNILNTGQIMLTSMFVLAVFVRYVGILSHHVNWADVIIRLVIGFVLLQNYTTIMDTTRDIVSSIDRTVNPTQDYVTQYAQMSQTMESQNVNTTRQSILQQVTNAVVSFGRYTLRNLIINLSFILYAVISNIMESIRYCTTAILYQLGPVIIPFILFESTGRVVKGWFTSYVSVLSWPILWHIVLQIAVTVGQQIPTNGGLEQFACLNLAVCFVLIFSPFIINSLVAGVGAGSSAALSGLVSTNTAGNAALSGGNAGFKLAAAFVGERFIRNSTILPGNFKKFMLGDDKGDKQS
jgi:hypothetical protein